MAKNYNKTILQTSFTSLEMIYYLLKVVKDNGPFTYDEGKKTLFPQARARTENEAGGTWDPTKNDTHAELTLREMNLIREAESDHTKSEVSDLGNRFLNSFALTELPGSDGVHVKLKLDDLVSLEEKNQLFFDILVRTTVVQPRFGRNIRPYLILFKILLEGDMEGYISKEEWASYINDSSFLYDTHYEEIHNKMKDIRVSNQDVELQKSDRILTRLAGWKVLDKISIEGQSRICFALNEEFAKIVKINMVQPPQVPQKKKRVVEPRAFKSFAIPDTIVIDDSTSAISVEISLVDEQGINNGDKVIFVDEQISRLRAYSTFLIHEKHENNPDYDIDITRVNKINRNREKDIIEQFKEE